MLDAGVVGLVELPQGELVPGVHLAALVNAPAETVRDTIARPEAYPSFMPAVSEVAVQDWRGNVVGFTWRWRTSIFTLGGASMMTVLSPPPAQRARGYRIAV